MTLVEKLHAAFPWSAQWGVGKTTRDLILYLHVCRGYSKMHIAQIAGISAARFLMLLNEHGCNFEPIKHLITDKFSTANYNDMIRLTSKSLQLKYQLTEDEVKHGRERRNIRRS